MKLADEFRKTASEAKSQPAVRRAAEFIFQQEIERLQPFAQQGKRRGFVSFSFGTPPAVREAVVDLFEDAGFVVLVGSQSDDALTIYWGSPADEVVE